jgi:predicted ATP-dependent endonuclease of OLD family
MRIDKLILRNFRSFGPKEATLIFPSDIGYYVIVGPNASGKSNIIEAIRWVTLQRNIYGAVISESDFFNKNTQETLSIEAHISPPIKQGTIYNQFAEAEVLKLVAQEYKVSEEKGSIRCDHQALKADGGQIMLPGALKMKKGVSLTGEEKEAKLSSKPLLVRDISHKYKIFFLDNSNYNYHLSMKRGSLASYLVNILSEDLMRDSNNIQTEEGEKTRLEILESLEDKISNLLLTDRIKLVLNSVKSFLDSQMRLPSDSVDLEIGYPRGSEIFKRLELNAIDSPELQMLPLERLGRGFGALTVVGLFNALNNIHDLSDAIFILEEPEAYLGPNLRRTFARSLKKFADKGNQVFISTHSPEFFDALEFKSVVRVIKENSGETKCKQISVLPAKYSLDKAVKFIEPNISHLVFSNYVVLVEGPDDAAAFKKALFIHDVDVDLLNLSVISCGGKGNIPFLHSVCNELNIKSYMVVDEDYEAELKIIDPAGESYSIMRPDLEGALNTTKIKSRNVENVLTVLEKCTDKQNLKDNFVQIYDAIESIKKGFSL